MPKGSSKKTAKILAGIGSVIVIIISALNILQSLGSGVININYLIFQILILLFGLICLASTGAINFPVSARLSWPILLILGVAIIILGGFSLTSAMTWGAILIILGAIVILLD